jgi:hypothetical protein
MLSTMQELVMKIAEAGAKQSGRFFDSEFSLYSEIVLY